MPLSRRHLLTGLAATTAAATTGEPQVSTLRPGLLTSPPPLFEKPASISISELESRRRTGPVLATEIHDFAPFGYTGPFTPSPPHADLNPRRAVIITFRDHPHRFVFSHEASYVPWLELPEGVGLCNQFYETNKAAELFNDNGRKTRNSSVDILDPGPDRVWIRWNYICTHPDDNEHAKLRGTEDYVAYPNGLIWRRMTYQSLSPDEPDGYSWQPIDFFCPVRADSTWSSLFPRDPQHNDYLVGSVLDAYSPRRYDKFWDDAGHPRRIGDPELLLSICRGQGLAIVAPFKAGHLFTALGPASGFPANRSQVVDHSFKDTGGWGWGALRWDHWPIGWINSEAHDATIPSKYPWHFGQFSHYITDVDSPIRNAKEDFPRALANMDLNRWTERHVFYTLMGTAPNTDTIRRITKRWLDHGPQCANPASIANLA